MLFNKKRLLASLILVVSPVLYSAETQHNHDGMPMEMQMQQDKSHSDAAMFLKKMEVDGYTVSFHVMKANDNMHHGGSHDFMIKIEKDGKVEQNVLINSKVIDPNGKAESKKLMKMGDWYMAGYDLGENGKYQLMILFKTADGKKHKAGVYYSR